jgi:ADP-ribose pyrophosphatase YjhB (NUDIX family)
MQKNILHPCFKTFDLPDDSSYFHSMENVSQPNWLNWVKELQFIAQAGLTYTRDDFDKERFERIRDIAAEMMSEATDLPFEKVKNLFCNEEGFQTPKLDTRAAIFQQGKILLVKERNGKWSLPGGWVDVLETVKTNTEKEVKEEAGLDVEAVRLIAVQDRNHHNDPPYAYNVCKVFVLCELKGGAFVPNIETLESSYFDLDELPPLATEKNNQAQLAMCFRAYQDPGWQVLFD